MKGGYKMKVVQTKDTLSTIYLDAVRIRNQVLDVYKRQKLLESVQ